jgi:hypothetical protein
MEVQNIGGLEPYQAAQPAEQYRNAKQHVAGAAELRVKGQFNAPAQDIEI